MPRPGEGGKFGTTFGEELERSKARKEEEERKRAEEEERRRAAKTSKAEAEKPEGVSAPPPDDADALAKMLFEQHEKDVIPPEERPDLQDALRKFIDRSNHLYEVRFKLEDMISKKYKEKKSEEIEAMKEKMWDKALSAADIKKVQDEMREIVEAHPDLKPLLLAIAQPAGDYFVKEKMAQDKKDAAARAAEEKKEQDQKARQEVAERRQRDFDTLMDEMDRAMTAHEEKDDKKRSPMTFGKVKSFTAAAVRMGFLRPLTEQERKELDEMEKGAWGFLHGKGHVLTVGKGESYVPSDLPTKGALMQECKRREGEVKKLPEESERKIILGQRSGVIRALGDLRRAAGESWKSTQEVQQELLKKHGADRFSSLFELQTEEIPGKPGQKPLEVSRVAVKPGESGKDTTAFRAKFELRAVWTDPKSGKKREGTQFVDGIMALRVIGKEEGKMQVEVIDADERMGRFLEKKGRGPFPAGAMPEWLKIAIRNQIEFLKRQKEDEAKKKKAEKKE